MLLNIDWKQEDDTSLAGSGAAFIALPITL